MTKKSIDNETRERIRAWVIHLMRKHEFKNAKAFALHIGLKQSTQVTTIISRKKTGGLDFVLKLHRVFHIETDRLLDHYPPQWDPSHEEYRLS